MKTIFCLFIAALLLANCTKNNDSNEKIDQSDLLASQNMKSELLNMQLSLTSLSAAQSSDQRHHWDSAFNHHDSLFWLHHNIYHHNTYTHDDHGHQWVPYDPSINHHSHYHHPYPAHTNDSLVTILNNHHHNNDDHHFTGHDLTQHHTLDSLHFLHNFYHP